MTRRISAVAVCCSSASFVSLNSRTFSMAMTAWSAKVRRRSISRSVKGCILVRRTSKTPIARPSRTSGVARMVRTPSSCIAATHLWEIDWRASGYVFYLRGLAVARMARPLGSWRLIGTLSDTQLGQTCGVASHVDPPFRRRPISA